MSFGGAVPLPNDREFQLYQKLILERLGIFLPEQKKALLGNRLWKRLKACNLNGFSEYYRFILSAEGRTELNTALELVTTNETYFFREQKHFDFLRDQVLPKYSSGKKIRIWSAAASTGEEPYSIAMLLRDRCVSEWELMCSDVNTRVLAQAKRGIFPDARAEHIPEEYLRRFCRKGIGPQEGSLRVVPELRDKVEFFVLNLNQPFPDLGLFDVIFLRNVLIYFELDTKRKVLDRIARALKPGGYLFVGHSESLHGVSEHFIAVKPAIYRLA